DVERLAAGWFASGIQRDLLYARLGLPQQILASPPEHLAALVNCDRFFERHLALFEPLDDRFEFLDRPLERHLSNIAVVFLRHRPMVDRIAVSAIRSRGFSAMHASA